MVRDKISYHCIPLYTVVYRRGCGSDGSTQALNTLTKNDITEVKSMKSPPSGVKLVMEAVCIMKNIKPRKIQDPAGGIKKVDDYWGPSQVRPTYSVIFFSLSKNIP
eukprot:7292936-Pyramimonas_sp.AAC.1